MSWLQRLIETYDACFGRTDLGEELLAPVGSVPQRTQLHVRLWEDGTFRHAEFHEVDNTPLFVTEDSAGRSGTSPAPNPLTEQLEYCASGVQRFGGNRTKFERYNKLLSAWVDSELADAKVEAVRKYVQSGTLLDDLIRSKVLTVRGNKLADIKVNKSRSLKPLKLWVRWSVRGFGLQEETWSDTNLGKSWAQFDYSLSTKTSFCMFLGELTRTTQKHPKRIRDSADSSKLISSQDKNGYTYRGRFTTSSEALTVGYRETQKAHNALRWLIARQGSAARHDTQVVVAWAVQGQPIPPLTGDSQVFHNGANGEKPADSKPISLHAYRGDAGQHYARLLAQAVSGYGKRLDRRTNIVVMALDSATDGRMSILFYRELAGSEFLARLERWHREVAWPQNLGEERRFVGAPAPRDIARAAYGRKVGKRFEVEESALKLCVERLLPCIVDGRPVPRDLIRIVSAQTVRLGAMQKPESIEEAEFERSLGIACALIKSSLPKEDQLMALDETRTTRSYLYGRLLAVAEVVERRALRLAQEKRETNANRYFQAFSDRPFETWLIIANALKPYEARLRSSTRAGNVKFLNFADNLRNTIGSQFDPAEFCRPRTPLDAEFLLGYYCQRAALRKPKAN